LYREPWDGYWSIPNYYELRALKRKVCFCFVNVCHVDFHSNELFYYYRNQK